MNNLVINAITSALELKIRNLPHNENVPKLQLLHLLCPGKWLQCFPFTSAWNTRLLQSNPQNKSRGVEPLQKVGTKLSK